MLKGMKKFKITIQDGDKVHHINTWGADADSAIEGMLAFYAADGKVNTGWKVTAEEIIQGKEVNQMEEKKIYSSRIMGAVRQRMGIEEDDTSLDAAIMEMDPGHIFNEVCTWEGLINYGPTLKSWIEELYNINLDDYHMTQTSQGKGK